MAVALSTEMRFTERCDVLPLLGWVVDNIHPGGTSVNLDFFEEIYQLLITVLTYEEILFSIIIKSE